MPHTDDQRFMQLAIDASAQALAEGDVPFGASLVKAGELLHVSLNRQVTTNDPLAHAEIVLVREVLATLGKQALEGATVYASGEPCAMCTGALFWVGTHRIVYGASQREIIEALGGPELPIRSDEVLGSSEPRVRVDGPVLGSEAVAVLRKFRG